MAFSLALADRVRDELHRKLDAGAAYPRDISITEKKMFGGLAFLLHGKMAVGIWQQSLIARVGLEAYEAALKQPHVSKFGAAGKTMRGWVVVAPEAVDEAQHLRKWIDRAWTFVETLPSK